MAFPVVEFKFLQVVLFVLGIGFMLYATPAVLCDTCKCFAKNNTHVSIKD